MKYLFRNYFSIGLLYFYIALDNDLKTDQYETGIL